MNDYFAEKKIVTALQRENEKKGQELQELKLELEIIRSSRASKEKGSGVSQSRDGECEAELEALRQSFNTEEAEAVSWDHIFPINATSRPPSEGGDTIQIYEDEVSGGDGPPDAQAEDALVMGLELESARQAKRELLQAARSTSTSLDSLDDSPFCWKQIQMDMPTTPKTFYHDLAKQLRATTSRAEDAELALQALKVEVQGLGFLDDGSDAHACISAIASQFRQMRLDLERVVPGETVGGFDNAKLLPEAILKLKQLAQQLRDREAELKSMRDQQRSLKGNFDHAITAAEKANARVKELEEVIDSNAEEMLQVRMRAQALDKENAEKESTISSLVAALEKYRREVTHLEELVILIESEQAARLQDVRAATEAEFKQQISDMDAKVAAETVGRRAAEESAVDRLQKINDLEAALGKARQHSENVKEQLATLEMQVSRSNQNHEAEVGSLNSRVAGLATSLASANAEIDKLRLLNTKLEDRYRTEVEQGAQALEMMEAEFMRSVAKAREVKKSHHRSSKVRVSNWELESDEITSDDVGPMTPASLVRFVDVDDHVDGSVEVSRGKHRRSSGPGIKKGRRRYDSGIGMDSLSELDETEGAMTPDLSSEADIEADMM